MIKVLSRIWITWRQIIPLSWIMLLGLLLWPQSSFAEPATIFTQLTGSWRGNGEVRSTDGSKERIGCRGTYALRGGEVLAMRIRCASTSYKIDLESTLKNSGNQLTGQWQEKSFNADGSLSGSINGNKLVLVLDGIISGRLVINTSGAGHSVNLSTSGIIGLDSVSIVFSRG